MNGKNPFRVEKDGHVAWLILDRPDKRNAMGFSFYEGLNRHLDAFDRDPQVRVVIFAEESFGRGPIWRNWEICTDKCHRETVKTCG